MDDKQLAELMDITNDAEQLVEALKPGAMQNLLLELIKRYDYFIDSVTEDRLDAERSTAKRLTPERQALVEKAIARLTREGREVTNAAVLREAGGNHTAVAAYLRDWRRGQEPAAVANGHTQIVREVPAPAPRPVPADHRERLEYHLAEALARKASLEAELAQLRNKTWRQFRIEDVREFNRQMVGCDRAIEQVSRDIAQYRFELGRPAPIL